MSMVVRYILAGLIVIYPAFVMLFYKLVIEKRLNKEKEMTKHKTAANSPKD